MATKKLSMQEMIQAEIAKAFAAMQPAAQPIVEAQQPTQVVAIRANGKPAQATMTETAAQRFQRIADERLKAQQLAQGIDKDKSRRYYNQDSNGNENVYRIGAQPVREFMTAEKRDGKELQAIDANGNLTPVLRENVQKHTAADVAMLEREFVDNEGAVKLVGGLHVAILTGDQLAALQQLDSWQTRQASPMEFRRAKATGNAGVGYKASDIRYHLANHVTAGGIGSGGVIEFDVKLNGQTYGQSYGSIDNATYTME